MSECCCDDIIIEVNEEGVDGVGIASIELVSTVGITKNYRINLTNGTHFDYSISDGSSIASISKTSSVGLVDTYTVLLTSGETSTFEVTNGNGISSITKTSTDNLTDTYTIAYTNGTTSTFTVVNGNSIASVSKVSTQVLTDTYEITYTDEDKSPDTFTVVNGRGITSIAKTSTSGLVDTYTITYNDNSTSTFTVTNGEKGDKGDTGDTGNGIQSIVLLSESGLVKTYRITMTDGTHFDFDVTDGEKGDTGETGATGNGIQSIEKTATVGLVDTYTITMTDGTTTTFDVTNGSDEWGAIVGNLSDQTDLQNALDSKAPAITETASGSIASFTDGSALPVTALSVSIEPVQEGTGDPSPDNVRPITGWTGAKITKAKKNIYNFVSDEEEYTTRSITITHNADGSITLNGTASDGITINLMQKEATAQKYYTTCHLNDKYRLKAGIYTISCVSTSGDNAFRVIYGTNVGGAYNATGNNTIPATDGIIHLTLAVDSWLIFVKSFSKDAVVDMTIKFQIEVGETGTTYEPFTGEVLPISWETEAGTVYGGNLDVTTGMLTVDRVMVDLGALTWSTYQSANHRFRTRINNYYPTPLGMTASQNGQLCSIYKSSDYGPGGITNEQIKLYILSASEYWLYICDERFTDGSNVNLENQQFSYLIASPITVQLTPAQMQTLLGENHIWADTGDTSVTYRADTKLFIQEQIAESETLTRKMIADIATTDGKAQQSLDTGDLIIVGNELRKTTESIGQGSAITDQNSTVANLADVVKALQQ